MHRISVYFIKIGLIMVFASIFPVVGYHWGYIEMTALEKSNMLTLYFTGVALILIPAFIIMFITGKENESHRTPK